METKQSGLITWVPDPQGIEDGDMFGNIGEIRVAETYRNSKGLYRASVGTGASYSTSLSSESIADLQAQAEDFLTSHFAKYGLVPAHQRDELLEALKEARIDLSNTRSNIQTDLMMHGNERWDGVPEKLKARLDQIDAAIARATGASQKEEMK